jgi:hypothetical protein
MPLRTGSGTPDGGGRWTGQGGPSIAVLDGLDGDVAGKLRGHVRAELEEAIAGVDGDDSWKHLRYSDLSFDASDSPVHGLAEFTFCVTDSWHVRGWSCKDEGWIFVPHAVLSPSKTVLGLKRALGPGPCLVRRSRYVTIRGRDGIPKKWGCGGLDPQRSFNKHKRK